MSKRQVLTMALLLSLGANLLMAGLFVGTLGRQRDHAPPPLEWSVAPLENEVRDRIRRELRDSREAVQPLRERLREAMDAVRSAAEAEELDPVRLREALARLRAAQVEYQAFLHNNMLDIAVRLPREQRLALLRQAMDVRRRGRPPPPPPGQ